MKYVFRADATKTSRRTREIQQWTQRRYERTAYTSSDSLTNEPRPCKAFSVGTFFELLSCESVAIGRKAAVSIGFFEP